MTVQSRNSTETDQTEPLSASHAARRWSREAIQEFAFPQLPRPQAKIIKRHSNGAPRAHLTAPGLPPQLDVTAVPAGSRPRVRLRAGSERVNPLFVYPPDDRRTFTDTTYPWRACGRVVTPAGQGSGTIVGPQHVLTASHVVDWAANADGTIGWLRFEPDFNNGDTFAPAYSTTVYSYEKLSTVSGEYDVAEDYVVCVMDRRIGDELGWLGTKTYNDGWDGNNYWVHVGYPDDVGNAQQPVFEGNFSIANSWSPGFFETGSGLDMETFASLNHGDSGGPIFGFWSDGPYVVGVVSAEGTLDPVITDPQARTANWVAGGHEMPDLVNQARSDHP